MSPRRRTWRAPFGALGYGTGLAAVWVLLWGSVSAANVLSGALVATLLIWWLVPIERRRAQTVTLRVGPLLRLAAFLLRQLVVANLILIREVLAPRTRLRIGVIGVPVVGCSEQVITTLANFMAMAPGSMPIELRGSPPTLYVHVLHLHDVEDVRAELLHLRDLTVRALGSGTAIAALEHR